MILTIPLQLLSFDISEHSQPLPLGRTITRTLYIADAFDFVRAKELLARMAMCRKRASSQVLEAVPFQTD
jgi:hypothetical protein